MSSPTDEDAPQLQDLEPGDLVTFTFAGNSAVHRAHVETSSVASPSRPEDASTKTGQERRSERITVSLSDPDTETRWRLSRTETRDRASGPIRAEVRTSMRSRYPPRYRWDDRGEIESLSVIELIE